MSINRIEDLLKFVYELNPVNGNLCFRGQSKYSRKLIPSIHRLKETPLKRYQTIIYEAFLLYLHQDPSIPKTHIYTNHPIEFLAMCQHYRVPTRLLDWSKDILTALFFSCETHHDNNGAIFICDKSAYKDLDLNIFHETTNEVKFIDTPIINPRLRSQSGCFMLWGKKPLDSATSESYTLEDYNKQKYQVDPVIKIEIKSSVKGQIIEELKYKYSITHDSIYQNNEFSKKMESEYKFFRTVSSYITKEITSSDEESPLFKFFPWNFAGTENLQSFPPVAPNGFSNFVKDVVINLME